MNIKAFLKDNPMLVFGLGLPFVMVLIFAVAGGLLEVAQTPPQHDIFFSTEYYAGNSEKGIKLEVENDRLVVTAPENGCHEGSVPKLFRYSPRENTLKEIKITLPPKQRRKGGAAILDHMNALGTGKQVPGNECAFAGRAPVPVPELEGVKVSNSTIAPDGYQFMPYDYRDHRGGILPHLFFGSDRERYRGVLKKNGHRHVLPQAGEHYQTPQFVAWVVP